MVINKFPNREVYEKIKEKGSLGADDVNVLEDYPGLEWKGEYSSTAIYVKGDIVYYENMLYVMVSASVIGAIPGIDNDWIDFAKRSVTSSDVTNALGFTPADSTKVLPLSGGTLTGNLTGKYIIGTWLQATDAGHLATTPTKIPVFDDKGWIYYRTPAEILKDIGASSGYTLTEADKTEIAGKVTAGGLEFTLADPPTGGDLPEVLGNLGTAMTDAAEGAIPIANGENGWTVEKLIKTYTGDADLIGYIPDTVWVAAYMAAQKELLKLLPDSAAADAGKLLQVGADGNAAWGDKLPTALKNPKALTFTGAATGTYDGSEDLTVNIPAGGSSSSGGALKAMSAVGEYIGIPEAELPENGVVWMCIADGAINQEYYSGTITMQGGALSSNNMMSISSNGVIQLNQVAQVSDGIAIYGMSAVNYTGVYQVVGAGGGGGSGSESWALVAETTTTENVNLLRVTFDACSAVAIEFYWGGVENALGNIGIFPNAEGTPYIAEKRFAAANVTSSATKKCGVLCAQIDCRVGSNWYATSWQKDRGDGSFGAIDASKYNNLDIGVNGSAQYSLINNYYMNPRNDTPASGVRSITAYGAGMAIGTTLKVWGIKK